MGKNSKDAVYSTELRAIRRKKIGKAIQTVGAVIVTLIMIFPIYWMVITSLKTQQETLLMPPSFWPEFGLQFENYLTVFKKASFSKYYINTVVMTVGILVGQVTTGVLAAYGFAIGHFKGRDILFYIVLGALMVPIQVTFIPLFIMCSDWKMNDTFAGLILPHLVSAYYIYMMRNAFLSVDSSYIDAGKMDGLGRLGTILHVLVPMCKSTLITVTLLTITSGWNSYFWPKIIARAEERRVLTIGLTNLKNTYAGQGNVNNHEIMAGAVMAVIPIVILFILGQKYMMTGYSKAAMK